VGFTATNSSFIIGQAFLTHEAEEDYIWVLQWIRELYEKYELPTPESITTDKAGGLHAACGVVWPEVPHLLCRWHIDKDVKSYYQNHWLIRTQNHVSNEARKAIIDEKVKEFTDL
jgi:MULE transposase domain